MSTETDIVDLAAPILIMLLLALFTPLFGAILALFVLWHSNRNGLTSRRNAAAVCAALALVNLFVPSLIAARIL